MSYLIRKPNPSDTIRLETLIRAYMQETYQRAWAGSIQLLQQHMSGNEVDIIVAEASDQQVIAFAAWVSTYDLHHCMKGGEVIDFYVSPSHRSRGVAILLITNVAMEIQGHGGTYLKGGAVDNPVVHRLYRRFACSFSGGEYYVSGRAFRRLAELSGKSLREVVSNLPEREWNREP